MSPLQTEFGRQDMHNQNAKSSSPVQELRARFRSLSAWVKQILKPPNGSNNLIYMAITAAFGFCFGIFGSGNGPVLNSDMGRCQKTYVHYYKSHRSRLLDLHKMFDR